MMSKRRDNRTQVFCHRLLFSFISSYYYVRKHIHVNKHGSSLSSLNWVTKKVQHPITLNEIQNTAVGVREIAPLPSSSSRFATNFDARIRGACCEECNDVAFASRIFRAANTRLARDWWVPTLSREYRLGGKIKCFIKFTGPNDWRWSVNVCAALL